MELIITSTLVLFSLGLLAAMVLAVASRLLSVDEDPRVEAVNEALPGANCGGCGYAGCESFAAAVIYDPEVSPGMCRAGGSDTAEKVALLSGKAVGDSVPMVAFRRCDRIRGNVKQIFDYKGVHTCRAAKTVGGGPYACVHSCFGLGDCIRACPFSGMRIHNGIVYTNPDLCTACGTCIRACPNSVLELIPKDSRVMIFCATRDRAKTVSAICDVGCISCRKCMKSCPAKAISMRDNTVHIDHVACLEYGPGCGEACVADCPRGILRCLGTCAAETQLSARETHARASA